MPEPKSIVGKGMKRKLALLGLVVALFSCGGGGGGGGSSSDGGSGSGSGSGGGGSGGGGGGINFSCLEGTFLNTGAQQVYDHNNQVAPRNSRGEYVLNRDQFKVVIPVNTDAGCVQVTINSLTGNVNVGGFLSYTRPVEVYCVTYQQFGQTYDECDKEYLGTGLQYETTVRYTYQILLTVAKRGTPWEGFEQSIDIPICIQGTRTGAENCLP